MSDTHEVISAFLDDEPFDPRELADALADPSGRALLIDFVALRHLAQPDDAVPVNALRPQTWRSSLRLAVVAAALVMALFGGYAVGERRGATASAEPPSATRVVQAGAAWQEIANGGGR